MARISTLELPPELKHIKGRLEHFIASLRGHSFNVSTSDIHTAYKLFCTPYIQSFDSLHDALRSVFCKSKRDWLLFSSIFYSHWYRLEERSQNTTDSDQILSSGGGASGLSYFSESEAQNTATYAETTQQPDPTQGGASDAQVLSQRDFRFVFNPSEMRNIEQLIDILSRQISRRTRRKTKNTRKTGQLDPRQIARANLRHGGWPFELRYRQKRKTPARFVLLLDVSQSMEIYSYLFLRFARGLLQAFSDTDAFAFHTDLVPIGAELKDKNTRRLENKLKELSSGWLGGTRIADSLEDFNDNYSSKTINRNTIVFIFSDGYDSSEPEALVSQVLKIKDRCRRIVWVNPLLGRNSQSTSSVAVDRCIEAVQPHLDLYTSAHSLNSLNDLGPAFSLK